MTTLSSIRRKLRWISALNILLFAWFFVFGSLAEVWGKKFADVSLLVKILFALHVFGIAAFSVWTAALWIRYEDLRRERSKAMMPNPID